MKPEGTEQFPEIMTLKPVLANQSKTLSQALTKPSFGATSGGKRKT